MEVAARAADPVLEAAQVRVEDRVAAPVQVEVRERAEAEPAEALYREAEGQVREEAGERVAVRVEVVRGAAEERVQAQGAADSAEAEPVLAQVLAGEGQEEVEQVRAQAERVRAEAERGSRENG